jgi:hypothetical protein
MISTHWRTSHAPTDNDFRLFDVLVRQAADLIERAQANAALSTVSQRLIEAQETNVPTSLESCTTMSISACRYSACALGGWRIPLLRRRKNGGTFKTRAKTSQSS